MKTQIITALLIILSTTLTFAQSPKISKYSGDYFGFPPPGEKPVVFAPGLISTDEREYYISFSNDGKLCTFCRVSNDGKDPEMHYMLRTKKGWTKPSGIPYLTQKKDRYHLLATKGHRLYFSSSRSFPAAPSAPILMKLWQMDFIDNRWHEPILVDFYTQTKDFIGHVTMSNKGNFYFWAYNEREGKVLGDLFYSKLENGKYGKIRNMGNKINKSAEECDPFVDPQERYILYMVKKSPLCLGGFDLFISFKKKDGSWSEGVNLGPKINSTSLDMYPRVSPDGKYLFFSSKRSGNMKIYWCSTRVFDKFKPKE